MGKSNVPFIFGFLIVSGILLMALNQLSANQISEASIPRIQMVTAENRSNTTSGTLGNNTIILNAVEHVENETAEPEENETAETREEYRWADSSGIENPDLNINSNTEYTIKIDNPTDEEHELIIDSESAGNTSSLAGSGDIEPGKNVEFKFKAEQVGELGYHCKYHPNQMNGTITVS